MESICRNAISKVFFFLMFVKIKQFLKKVKATKLKCNL